MFFDQSIGNLNFARHCIRSNRETQEFLEDLIRLRIERLESDKRKNEDLAKIVLKRLTNHMPRAFIQMS